MSDNKAKTHHGKPRPVLGPAATDAIARRLKRVYDDIASEPVPDRFAELLDELERNRNDTD